MSLASRCSSWLRKVGALLLGFAVVTLFALSTVAQPEITQVGPVPVNQIDNDGPHQGLSSWASPGATCAPSYSARPFGGTEVPIYGKVSGKKVAKWTLAVQWAGEYSSTPSTSSLGSGILGPSGFELAPVIPSLNFQNLALVIAEGYNTDWAGEICKWDTTRLANGPWRLILTAYEMKESPYGQPMGYTPIEDSGNPSRQVVYVYNSSDIPSPWVAQIDVVGTPMPSQCKSQYGFVVSASNGCLLDIWGATLDKSSETAPFVEGYYLEWWRSGTDEIFTEGLTVSYTPFSGNRACQPDVPCDAPIARWDLGGICHDIAAPTVLVLRLTVVLNVIVNDGAAAPPMVSKEVTLTVVP